MLKTKQLYLVPDGAEGGVDVQVTEQPTEQVEFIVTPDGLTDAERAASTEVAAPKLDPNVQAMLDAMKLQTERPAPVANPPTDAGLSATLEKMSQVLESQNAPKKEQKTLEALKEEIKDLWFSDPTAAQMKVLEFHEQTRLGPALGQLVTKMNDQEALIQELRGQNEKAGVAANPRAKFAVEKFGSEVEALAKQYKGQPGGYLRAAQEVSLAHDAEYMDVWFAEKMQKQTAVKPANNMAPPVVGAVGGGAGPTVVQKALTPAQEQDRIDRGLDRETYWLSVEKGWIPNLRAGK